MFRLSNFALVSMLMLLMSASLSAQTATQNSSATPTPPHRQIIASVSDNSIRFTSLGELIEIRLEVIAPSGEVLFDSDFKRGNLIDWPVADKQGARFPDGSYLCIVTVKDPSGHLTRKHAIALLRNHSLGLKQADGSLFTPAQAQAGVAASGEDFSITIIDPGDSPATAVLAHDGNTAHLVSGSGGLSISSGDFFANKLLEHIRLTAEGNVGIGVANPQAKLDVAGLIRASQGIIFPDGTVQYSASSKTLGAKSSRSAQKPGKPDSGDDFEIQSITNGHIVKFTDNAGTLGDSIILESSGRLGIGTNTPDSLLNVQGVIPSQLGHLSVIRATGSFNGFGLLMDATGSGNNALGLAVGGAPKAAFSWDNARNFFGMANFVFSANDFSLRLNADGSLTFHDGSTSAERFRVTAPGNVGIGIATPAARLDVAGNINSSTQYLIRGTAVLNVTGAGSLVNSNTFVGPGAGASTTPSGTTVNGNNNSFFGRDAGAANTNGFGNSLFGRQAGASITVGFGNSFFGDAAGNATTGSNNSFFGRSAGLAIPSVTETSLFGAIAGSADGLTNATAIGFRAFVAQSNSLVLGSINGVNGAASDTKVGIGTTTPARHLHVFGAGDQQIAIESSDQGGRQWTLQASQGTSDGRFEIVDRTRGANGFTISSTGNVGIGTTSPAARLHVSSDVSDNDGNPAPGESVALIENTNRFEGQGVLALKTDVAGDPIFTDNYITFFKANNVSVGAIEGNGSGGVQFAGPGNDYAEWLPRLNPAEQIQPGEIVGLYGGRISRNTRGASQVMALSTGSIVAGNDPGKDARGSYDLVAFIGQVRTRVRGVVQAGDFIIASGFDDGTGVAVSPECITSEQFERVVGQAWEASEDSGVKSVRIAVGLIRRDPTVGRLLEYNRRQAAEIIALDNRLRALESKMATKTNAHKSIATRKRRASARGTS